MGSRQDAHPANAPAATPAPVCRGPEPGVAAMRLGAFEYRFRHGHPDQVRHGCAKRHQAECTGYPQGNFHFPLHLDVLYAFSIGGDEWIV